MPIPALEAYKLQIVADISTQSAPDSIDPSTVGSGYTDLVDIITPYLEFDENRVYSAGSTVPDDLDGADGDIYFQGESAGTVTVWQKVTGAWVNNGSFNINADVYFTNSGTTGIASDLATGIITVTMASFPTIAADGIIRGNFDLRYGADWICVDVPPTVTKTAGVITSAVFDVGNILIDEIRGRIF